MNSKCLRKTQTETNFSRLHHRLQNLQPSVREYPSRASCKFGVSHGINEAWNPIGRRLDIPAVESSSKPMEIDGFAKPPDRGDMVSQTGNPSLTFSAEYPMESIETINSASSHSSTANRGYDDATRINNCRRSGCGTSALEKLRVRHRIHNSRDSGGPKVFIAREKWKTWTRPWHEGNFY